MTTFIGTKKEYHRHVGPRIRNKVQAMTKQYRSGACQHCGKSGVTIEAAHVHGRERKQIIQEVIGNYWNGKEYILDLDKVEQEIVAAHEPIENTFLFLCKDCHIKYDSQEEIKIRPTTLSDANTSTIGTIKQTVADCQTPTTYSHSSGALPLEFKPGNKTEFKKALLEKKYVWFNIQYSDGKVEKKQWDARNMKENSNVIGNIRSRPEFRKNKWRKSGIVKVICEVMQ